VISAGNELRRGIQRDLAPSPLTSARLSPATDFNTDVNDLRPSPAASAGAGREAPAATTPTRPAPAAGRKEEI
jgi:hypothetical protein